MPLLQSILSGQAPSVVLLKIGVLVFLYFLPSIIAFSRGHRRFWIILPLNVVVTFVQSVVLFLLFPGLLASAAHDMQHAVLVGALANYGIGWLLLMVWALRPVADPDPRLIRAQATKTYDAIAGLPLILWFAYGVLQLRPVLVRNANLVAAGQSGLFPLVQFISLSMAMLFYLLLIYLLLVRDRPVAKSHGVLPRLFGFVGSFMGVSILQLDVARLDMGGQMLAALLIGVGSLASALVLWRLGKSFSIMPEARKLVTGGPYAFARHPLYTVEMITVAGTALQFKAPWSWLLAILVIALLWGRSRFEEQVLERTFPEYADYRARTKRFIPGVI
jgi:protein-S-isoprenylcysteine O-methyltransferase Ste14